MSSKPTCKYGNKCYRKNPDHLRNFSHPKKSDDEEETNADPDTSLEEQQKDEGNKRGMERKSSSLDEEPSLKKRRTNEDLPTPDSESKDETDQKDEKEANQSDKKSDEKESSNDENTPPPSPEDVKESIKSKFLVDMPDDFYQFWDLCHSLNPSNPQGALKCLKLNLVGPYDVLAGKHKKVKKNKYGKRPNFLLHYRFFYDPPEFQTVLVSGDNDKLHFGYFRDDPSEKPVFVASNSPGSVTHKEKITPCGDNLFAAVHIHATKRLKSATPFDKTSIQKLIKAVEEKASKHHLELAAATKDMKNRQKKVVCPSFHGAGIVVPVDDNEIGYRPVPETPADLRAMLKRIAEAKLEKDKDRHMEELEELITLVQFANDECDYGEGLELGMDLFSFGSSVFHPQISILLPLAYQLLNRHEFASIIKAHLDRRKSVDKSVDELAV